jgi:hypothetical protein
MKMKINVDYHEDEHARESHRYLLLGTVWRYLLVDE